MPQQDDAIGFTERSGTCFSTSSADWEGAERLLVAMAMHMRRRGHSLQRQRGLFARQEFAEQHAPGPASASAAAPGSSERNSSRSVSRQDGSSPITGRVAAEHVERAARLAARLVHHADREVGASAA